MDIAALDLGTVAVHAGSLQLEMTDPETVRFRTVEPIVVAGVPLVPAGSAKLRHGSFSFDRINLEKLFGDANPAGHDRDFSAPYFVRYNKAVVSAVTPAIRWALAAPSFETAYFVFAEAHARARVAEIVEYGRRSEHEFDTWASMREDAIRKLDGLDNLISVREVPFHMGAGYVVCRDGEVLPVDDRWGATQGWLGRYIHLFASDAFRHAGADGEVVRIRMVNGTMLRCDPPGQILELPVAAPRPAPL